MELPGIEGDGRNVLTNSRIRCFQTCRRKHFYEYELGVERQDEEEREALYFGNLWHAALEAWFLASQKGVLNDDTNCASNSAGSGHAAAGASRNEQPPVSGCDHQQG
jgi:CRISPR/Cas system-associated exonuclease Cas4 (RecB family)